MDYQGNAHKGKQKDGPEKVIEKVITGTAVVKKKTIGEKVKGIIREADFKGVTRYVVTDIMIPAVQRMIVEGSARGIERMIYGEEAMRRRGPMGGRMTHLSGSQITRTDYRSPFTRPPVPNGAAYPRSNRDDFILETREEAQLVLQSMSDIIESWDACSVADLHELLGWPVSPHTDNKWGWTNIDGARVLPVREGFLIDLPPVQSI